MTLRSRPTLSAPEHWDYPRFEQATTAQGLPVWSRHLPNQPRLALQLIFDAPVGIEPPEQRGVANLMALSLDEGTPELTASEFADRLDRAGSTFGTGVDAAAIYVSARVPRWRLDEAMPLIADGVTRPVFPDAEVDRLVHQRLDSIRRELVSPEARAVREFRRHGVAAGHRLSWPTAGDADTVAELGRADVVDFHRDAFVPRALAFVIAGDLEGVDPVALAETWLAELHVARDRHPVVPLAGVAGPRTVVVDRPGAVQTSVRIGGVGPDRSADEWAALRLASYVLGGSITGRLNTVLREEKGYTYGMHSLLRSQRAGGFVVAATGSVHTEVTGAAVADTLGLITALVEDGPEADELANARAALVGSQPLRTETVGSLAAQVAQCLAEDLPHDHVPAVLARIRQLDADDVLAAARTHLHPDDLSIVAVGDADTIADDLAALGHGEFVLVPYEGESA